MTFKKLSDEKIGQIIERARAGQDVSTISNEIGVSEGSAIKYIKRGGLRPVWGTRQGASQPGEAQNMPALPAQATSQPPMMVIPASYAPPSVAPSKLEERSPLSPDADWGRDEMRILQNQLDRFKLESSLRNLEHERPTQDLASLLKIFSELRQQEAQGTQTLGGHLESLRQENQALVQQLIEARSLAAMQSLEGRLSGQIAALSERLAHSSARIDELKFWRETAESLPSVIGRTVDETGGKLIERASHIGAAMGAEWGGAFGTPRPIKPITMPSHKVLTIEQRRRAQEVLPLPEQELEAMQQQLESEFQEGREPHRRDLDRERRLAEEVLKLRSELEQIHARKSPPPPISPADTPRKVIRATQEAEPNVG